MYGGSGCSIFLFLHCFFLQNFPCLFAYATCLRHTSFTIVIRSTPVSSSLLLFYITKHLHLSAELELP